MLLELVERALVIWRVSRLLVSEAGPFDAMKKLRILSGIEYNTYDDSVVSSYPAWNPLHCIYCTSIWVMVASMVLPKWAMHLLAANGLAMLVQQMLDSTQHGSS